MTYVISSTVKSRYAVPVSVSLQRQTTVYIAAARLYTDWTKPEHRPVYFLNRVELIILTHDEVNRGLEDQKIRVVLLANLRLIAEANPLAELLVLDNVNADASDSPSIAAATHPEFWQKYSLREVTNDPNMLDSENAIG